MDEVGRAGRGKASHRQRRLEQTIANIDRHATDLNNHMRRAGSELTWWMFAFWMATVVPIAALVVART